MRIFLLLLSILSFLSCQNQTTISPKKNYAYIEGETMGTTYHIKYSDSLVYKKEVDSILIEINQAVSTYIPDSDISRFNKNELGVIDRETKTGNYFFENFAASQLIYDETNGFFDPTVMPLVNYWGFGYMEKKPVSAFDSLKVDSIQQSVGFAKVSFKTTFRGDSIIFEKTNPNTQLDFSAIAKGYAVDVIAEFFDKKNIQNYLVEIGGELRVKGKNDKGKLWTSAINTPKVNAKINDFAAIIELDNKSIATSGNYRNFYQVGDDWYGHTINPKTGFPEKSNLLSVSVMADDCMTADGFATAMMVMGLEKSKALAEKLNYLDAFFIFANEKGELEIWYTEGFEGRVRQ